MATYNKGYDFLTTIFLTRWSDWVNRMVAKQEKIVIKPI